MSTYETVFITTPNLTEEDERATVDAMAEIVNKGGGTFIANDRIGRRRLAYPIKKFEDGVYTRFLYDSGADVPTELERRIKISDKVLRVLTVRLEKEWAADAKEQAVQDAKNRAEAEARAVEEARLAAEAAASAAEEPAGETEPAVEAAEEPVEKEPAAETKQAEAEPTIEEASVVKDGEADPEPES